MAVIDTILALTDPQSRALNTLRNILKRTGS